MTLLELELRNKKKAIDINSFLKYCSKEFKMNKKYFTNHSRIYCFVEKRAIIYKILEINGYNQQDIADKLNRDRSIISYHLEKFKNKYLFDLHFKYEKFINDFVKSDFWAKTKKL